MGTPMREPVREDPLVRERYDRTWQLFPWEHPRAYWLRSDGMVILCLRCNSRFDPGSECGLDEDPEPLARTFSEKHMSCPPGFGVRGTVSRRNDPLFDA